ncbi:MAG: hypothetical protein ACRETW_12720, partial [Stenotrophobium sp.]
SDLEFRLRETRTFPPDQFLLLLTALADGSVVLPPTDVERLVTAALDNHRVGPADRASILNNYGRYQFTIRHDAQSAISLTLAAAELAPNDPLFQLNLANLALKLNQPAIAAQALDRAEKLDRLGTYQADIQKIKGRINDHP